MTYAVQQDLIDRFGEAELLEIADRDDDQVIDADVMARALSDADEVINSYIAKRYDLPLAATPALLVMFACNIARYQLFKDAATEEVTTRYNDTIKSLKDIAAGRADLDVGGSQPASAGDTVMTSGPARVHTADTLEGY